MHDVNYSTQAIAQSDCQFSRETFRHCLIASEKPTKSHQYRKIIFQINQRVMEIKSLPLNNDVEKIPNEINGLRGRKSCV